MKKIRTKVMYAILTLGIFTTNTILNTQTVEASTVSDANNVIADWRLSEDHIKSGSIDDKNLIIEDASGNGNDLRLNTYGNIEDLNQYISFSDDKMYDGTNGSLNISGDSFLKRGADLITVDEAPINKEEFEDGYTIELIYKLPDTWTVADKWSSLLARQGDSSTMDEPEVGTMNVAVSNCKEIQFLAANKDDNHEMSSASWSVSMDKGGVWYHIAIVSDNNAIRTFVNGAEAFRDYVNPEMQGLYADPNDGRFRIGSSWWKEGNRTLSKFAKGNYQQVRITEGALDKSEWLIPNPEEYAGEYGNNNEFSLKDNRNYNMVFLPDTQNTIKFRGQVMSTAMDWIVENSNNANIVSVTHLGDVVENGDNEEQWNTAKLFTKLPEAGVNLLMQPGNHDLPEYYDRYFGGDSEYGALTSDYVVRTSPSGRSTYMINDGGSYKYMTLAIDYHSFDTDLAWVEEVLSSTNMPTIITSHDLQNCSDTAPSDIKLSKKGQQVWDVVKKYNQVFIMIGGHSHGAGDQILINDDGNEVFNILADYQFAHNGGNALFKFAEFDEVLNKIYLSTFSPYAATLSDEERSFFDVNYLTGDGNYSEFDINFEERFAGMEKSENADKYDEVDNLIAEINNLPEEITLAHKELVNSLLARVNELGEEFKALINNLDKLNDAADTIKNIEALKVELEKLVLEVEALDKNKYTEESWNILLEKLTYAKDILKKSDLSTKLINEAKKALEDAKSSLVIKPEQKPEEKPEIKPENGKPSDKPGNGGSKPNDNKLPQTGGVNSAIFAMLGLTMCAGGVITRRKK